MRDDVAITLDVDWAPDFIIDHAARLLVEHGVKATWFITHASPAVSRLREHPTLFELGIHPNFLPGSTHGDTVAAVLAHCFELVPDARSVRTHALYQSASILRALVNEHRLTTDLSLFLPRMPGIQPVEFRVDGRTLLRVPYLWEDSLEIEHEAPRFELGELLAGGGGLKILNFHPTHVFLNSRTTAAYAQLKLRAPRLSDLTEEVAQGCITEGPGTQTMFRQALEHLAKRESWRVHDLVSSYRA
jgi:hypothetical protein